MNVTPLSEARRLADQQPFAPLDAYGEAKPPPPLPLDVDCAASLHGLPVPPQEWFVPGWMPRRVPSLINGAPGIGKTQLLLQLMVASSSTGLFLGIEVERGHTLFITTEDEKDKIHRRLVAITADMGVELRDLADLSIRSLAAENAWLAVPGDGEGGIVPTKRWWEIVERIKLDRPRALALDPVSQLYAGNENDRVQVSAFVRMMSRVCLEYDMTIVFAAHPSKAGIADGSGTSGSTGWEGAVRSRGYMRRPDGEAPDPNARVLQHMKINDGPLQEPLSMWWRNGALTIARSSDPAAAFRGDTTVDRIFLAMLVAYNREGRPVRASEGHGYAPKVFALDRRAEGATRNALRDAMNRLLQAGQVVNEEYGYASNRKHRLVVAGPDQ